MLFFEQRLQLFVRTGCSDVITVINVSVNGINVMDTKVAMMAVMNGIVVCINMLHYDEI